jgi:hypothetical protein
MRIAAPRFPWTPSSSKFRDRHRAVFTIASWAVLNGLDRRLMPSRELPLSVSSCAAERSRRVGPELRPPCARQVEGGRLRRPADPVARGAAMVWAGSTRTPASTAYCSTCWTQPASRCTGCGLLVAATFAMNRRGADLPRQPVAPQSGQFLRDRLRWIRSPTTPPRQHCTAISNAKLLPYLILFCPAHIPRATGSTLYRAWPAIAA